MPTIDLEDEITARLATQKISRAQIKRLYAIAKGDNYSLTSPETETVFNWVKSLWKVEHKADLPAIANDQIEELYQIYAEAKNKGLTYQEIAAAFEKTKQQVLMFNSDFAQKMSEYFEVFLTKW